MKRLISIVSVVTAVLTLLALPVTAFAETFWQLDMSTPASQNSRTFGVEYKVLSTDAGSFTVQLYQEGVEGALQTQNTGTSPSAANGNSGTFPVTVPADGTYTYRVLASRDADPSDTKSTTSKTVQVDATAPAAPAYAGKTRAGNTYTLSFTAPASPDVTQVQIFASTTTTYEAGETTQVGTVAVTPSQSASFTYTAPSAATRYFALRAFDSVGNGSAIVGDPGITVTPVRVITAANIGGDPGEVNIANANPAVLGAAIDGPNIAAAAGPAGLTGGEVNATGDNSTSGNSDNKDNAKVLGSSIEKDDVNSNAWWYGGGGLLLGLLALGYYYYVYRPKHHATADLTFRD